MKTDLTQLCDHCWVLQICWHIEDNIFTASSFRIWNSSAGIPSPWLASFVVMLLKALLTSHSRMFGSQWVTAPSWLSRSLRPFFYSFFLCVLATSSQSLLLLLDLFWFCPLLCPCWRRLLRVPWTARRSNQSLLKEISPGCSLEGLMLKLKLQYFGQLMWRVDSLEKTLMAARHHWLNGHEFE